MVNRRNATLLVLAALVLALGGFAAYRMTAPSDADSGGPAAIPDERPSVEDTASDGQDSPDGSDDMTTGAGGVSDPETGLVSDRDAYEVVDALRVAGHEPKMGTDLTFDWIGGSIDRVRVSGEFEDAGEASFELERRNGVWAVDE